MPDHRSPELLRVPPSMSPPYSLFLLSGFLLVTVPGNDFAHRSSGRAELHRYDARVADDLASIRADLLLRGREVVDLDRKVMDTRTFTRRLGLRGLRAGVVLHDRQVDRTVREMTRGMVAHLARLGHLEPEDFLVELRGALQVVDLERDMHDSIHGISRYLRPAAALSAPARPGSSRCSRSRRRASRIAPRRRRASADRGLSLRP